MLEGQPLSCHMQTPGIEPFSPQMANHNALPEYTEGDFAGFGEAVFFDLFFWPFLLRSVSCSLEKNA